MKRSPRLGLLLLNLGSPDAPTIRAVRKYLAEFLGDPRVLVMSRLKRWFVLHFIILRTRPKNSAHAYQSIWDSKRGSPLIYHSVALRDAIIKKTDRFSTVAIGMRYGNPSTESALDDLLASGVDQIIVAPLYPQYAMSTTATALERVYQHLAKKMYVPPITIVPPFYDHPAYIQAVAAQGRKVIKDDMFVLFSFHGLPESHLRLCDPTKQHCLAHPGCCGAISDANRNCYRAHCFATTRLITQALGLAPDRYRVTFQSRLGKEVWTRPYTDETIIELAREGIRKLVVYSPAFTADCLETIEELGSLGRDQFLSAGGQEYQLIPAVNDAEVWVDGLLEIIEDSVAISALE